MVIGRYGRWSYGEDDDDGLSEITFGEGNIVGFLTSLCSFGIFRRLIGLIFLNERAFCMVENIIGSQLGSKREFEVRVGKIRVPGKLVSRGEISR